MQLKLSDCRWTVSREDTCGQGQKTGQYESMFAMQCSLISETTAATFGAKVLP